MSSLDKSAASVNRGRRALSQSEPALLRQVKSQQRRSKSLEGVISGLRIGSLIKTWENISKINFVSMAHMENDRSTMSIDARRSTNFAMPPPADTSAICLEPQVSDDSLLPEQFPINVTPLLNEDQLWGCFYPFPELYGDAYSPVVRIRNLKDIPDIVGGVLTRDLVTACLTYLKRSPILGDYVYIKLDLSYKHLVNIEVLQHYKYLVYLDMSSNYLTDLSVLSHLLYLQFLTVSYNRLKTVLEYETPQWFLSEVQYKYNSVEKIRDISMFWSITVLDLSHNNIKCISGLEHLQYLRRLDLSFNHIQRLENLNQLRLLWLDVSYNNISSFEFGPQSGLWTLHHLEYLNLNENNLTTMKIFSGVTRLQELHVRNNRLGMLLELAVYMRQMRRLAILDLRANPVCSVPGYAEVVINTFPILLSLDAKELDPVEQRTLKMKIAPDVHAFATRRLLRLLYIEQLSKARVSPFVPPADTTDVPLVIFVGYTAVGKGALARRLAKECSANIELAIQHTTSNYHNADQYRRVTRDKFDEMLLLGEFLTYTEMNGQSYGLSREEAYVKDGKVKIATMDLTSALMLRLRGYRPYILLTTWMDKTALTKRQLKRKFSRDQVREDRSSVEWPIEKSALQVLISGRILVTGILNEILLTLPEEKEQSEFLIESECSLLMDSEARKAVQDYAKGVNLLTILSSGSSLETACIRGNKTNVQNDTSLYSLYKESQNTEEYASDINGQNSIQGSRKKSGDRGSGSKQGDTGGPKSYDFSRYVSSTWKGTPALNSSKSSKSVTFTSQDAGSATAEAQAVGFNESVQRKLTGLLIEPVAEEHKNENVLDKQQPRSLSKKFQWPMDTHGMQGRSPSLSSHEDADLWLTFLIETGLLQASDSGYEPHEPMGRRETKMDDPDLIMKQLAYYRLIPSQTFTTNIRDDYEDIHRQSPGMFWDTIIMDNPDEAFKKAKRIIKDIVESQKHLEPMFDIDLSLVPELHPVTQMRLNSIEAFIKPQKPSM